MSTTQQEMVPIFSIVSNDFDKDLAIIRRLFSGLEEITHTEHGFKLSNQAVLAAGWWFYDVYFTQDFARKTFEIILPNIHNPRIASNGIVTALEEQLRKHGSDAKIKVRGDMVFAPPLWNAVVN